MRRFPFVTVDVFTFKKLEGNQLAVFTDAKGLADAEMQALAREMAFSETTFIIPRAPDIEARHGVKVRIFTVESELPFAGHPTLGTAFVLRGATGANELFLDLPVGKIPVRFSEREGQTFGEMTQRDPEFGMVHRREEIASTCDISVDEIDPDLPIETVSTGNPFIIVALRSLDMIRNLAVEWRHIAKYAMSHDAAFFYFVTRQTEDPAATLQARMIFFGGEDPATGSAAGPRRPGWSSTNSLHRTNSSSSSRASKQSGPAEFSHARVWPAAAYVMSAWAATWSKLHAVR